MSESPKSGMGVRIKCSWCGREQELDLGFMYPHRVDAEFFLHLMTGGWFGKAPPGVEYKKTQPDDFSFVKAIDPEAPGIGESACCGKPLEGEVYGYPEEGT